MRRMVNLDMIKRTPILVEITTNRGEQVIGQGYLDYDYTVELSNKIEVYSESQSTLHDGYRPVDEIIADNIDKYSEVWKSLA